MGPCYPVPTSSQTLPHYAPEINENGLFWRVLALPHTSVLLVIPVPVFHSGSRNAVREGSDEPVC